MTTRKAILIGYAAEGEDYLPGVRKDLSNLYRYLQTPRGGGWLPEEITVLRGPSGSRLLRKIAQCNADYLLVYFSGHGMAEPAVEWTERGYRLVVNRWLAINGDELIRDVDLLHPGEGRQLVVCDCCRSRPGAAIGGIPETLAEWTFNTGEFMAARGAFDQYIEWSPYGAVVVHGAQDGQPSYDSRDGGRFTLTLLGGALDWRTGSVGAPISIEALVDYAGTVLRDARRAQSPEVVYQSGELQVPFGVDTPWPEQNAGDEGIPETTGRGGMRPAPVPEPATTWLILGGLLVGALCMAEPK